MAINPAISVRFTPGGFFINAAKTLGNDPFAFLLLVPHRTLGPVHHFVSADDSVLAPIQERAER